MNKSTNAQHSIGNSGADSCKLNICNSIGHLCKCWADVFQMPHHRQYVNRCKQPCEALNKFVKLVIAHIIIYTYLQILFINNFQNGLIFEAVELQQPL